MFDSIKGLKFFKDFEIWLQMSEEMFCYRRWFYVLIWDILNRIIVKESFILVEQDFMTVWWL